jgi:high affinity Mn2+ porin
LRIIVAILTISTWPTFAQSPALPQPADTADPSTPAKDASEEDTFWSRFWISGQANFMRQQHPTFYAKYSGPNSFLPDREHATSRVLTLYTGFQITRKLEILFDVESAGGAGLSNALGIAGFTNVDVVRNPTLGSAPYISRVMLHYTIPIGKATTEATPPKRHATPYRSHRPSRKGVSNYELER